MRCISLAHERYFVIPSGDILSRDPSLEPPGLKKIRKSMVAHFLLKFLIKNGRPEPFSCLGYQTPQASHLADQGWIQNSMFSCVFLTTWHKNCLFYYMFLVIWPIGDYFGIKNNRFYGVFVARVPGNNGFIAIFIAFLRPENTDKTKLQSNRCNLCYYLQQFSASMKILYRKT